MKKNKILVVLLLICVGIIMCNFVFASSGFGGGFEVPKNGTTIDQVGKTKGIFDNVFTTIITLIQIASVAGIVFCGVRYMYASADKKADIKSGLIPLTIGIALVFCASTVAQFVMKVFTQAT
ncbi:MAG: TrbC/VirB2 family protein [Clostridia bacterium]|nr:TrbC/VirB2 family protein [Clostridia bacterium]